MRVGTRGAVATAAALYGGGGAARLFPGNDAQTDILRSGPGPDRINARSGPKGHGNDRVFAGRGNDTVRHVETFGWLTPYVDCGPGDDTLVVPYRDVRSTRCEHIVRFHRGR